MTTQAQRSMPRTTVPDEHLLAARTNRDMRPNAGRQPDGGPKLTDAQRDDLIDYVARCLRHGAWEVAALACEQARSEPARLPDARLDATANGPRMCGRAASMVATMIEQHVNCPNLLTAASAIRERLRRGEVMFERVTATDSIDCLALEDKAAAALAKRHIETVRQLIDALENAVSDEPRLLHYVVSSQVDSDLVAVLEAHGLLGLKRAAWQERCRRSASRDKSLTMDERRKYERERRLKNLHKRKGGAK